MKTSTIKRACQRGASLVMSLIILVVLMLLGVSALMVSNTQQRLAGNIQLQALATAEAESALSQAENWLSQPANSGDLGPFGTGAGGLYAKDSLKLSGKDPLTLTWNDGNSVAIPGTDGKQRYIIEVYAENRTLPGNSVGNCGYGIPGPCPKVNLFRATARGVSSLGATKYVQSLFAVRTGSSS